MSPLLGKEAKASSTDSIIIIAHSNRNHALVELMVERGQHDGERQKGPPNPQHLQKKSHQSTRPGRRCFESIPSTLPGEAQPGFERSRMAKQERRASSRRRRSVRKEPERGRAEEERKVGRQLRVVLNAGLGEHDPHDVTQSIGRIAEVE